MAVLDLSFEWLVDDAGYKIVRRSKNALRESGLPGGAYIVRRKGSESSLRITRPLEINHTLFMVFAHLDGSDESCLQFANSFGFLGLTPDDQAEDHVGPIGESLKLWRREIAAMHDAVEVWQTIPDYITSGKGVTITDLQVSLVPIDGKPTLRLSPSSLIGAMRLQLAQAIAVGLGVSTCGHCGRFFETGGMGRRRKAKFCSDRCRFDYHNARRKVS